MPEASHRETMSALLAAHTAVRLARGVAYPEINAGQMPCKRCREPLTWENAQPPHYIVVCPSCHVPNEVPQHLRSFAYSLPDDEGDLPPVEYAYVQHEAPPAADYSVPTPLKIFFVWCLLAVVIVLGGTIWKVG